MDEQREVLGAQATAAARGAALLQRQLRKSALRDRSGLPGWQPHQCRTSAAASSPPLQGPRHAMQGCHHGTAMHAWRAWQGRSDSPHLCGQVAFMNSKKREG